MTATGATSAIPALPGWQDDLPAPPEPPSVVEQYVPPYTLRSDMLLVLALAPAAPLRRRFPRVPFLAGFGWTPLLAWFARVTEAASFTVDGRRQVMGGPAARLYDELTVAALLRERAVFVPGIWATSSLTIRIGQHYGMPKRPAAVRIAASPTHVSAVVQIGGRRSHVRAGLAGPHRWLGILVSRLLPGCAWPARFPDGREIRPLILQAPAVRPARLRSGWLRLDADWLPSPVRLLPLGVWAPGLVMRLPPPAAPLDCGVNRPLKIGGS